jgi:hypothetical protein
VDEYFNWEIEKRKGAEVCIPKRGINIIFNQLNRKAELKQSSGLFTVILKVMSRLQSFESSRSKVSCRGVEKEGLACCTTKKRKTPFPRMNKIIQKYNKLPKPLKLLKPLSLSLSLPPRNLKFVPFAVSHMRMATLMRIVKSKKSNAPPHLER